MATEKDKDTSDSNEIEASSESDPKLPSGTADRPAESVDAARPQTPGAGQTTEDITVDRPIDDLGSGDSSEKTSSAQSNITEILEGTPSTDASTGAPKVAANPFSDDTTEIITQTDSPLPGAPMVTPAPAPGETMRVTDPADKIPSPSKPSPTEVVGDSNDAAIPASTSNSASATQPKSSSSSPTTAPTKAPDATTPTPTPGSTPAKETELESTVPEQKKPDSSPTATTDTQTTTQVPLTPPPGQSPPESATSTDASTKKDPAPKPEDIKTVSISAEKATAEAVTVVNQKPGTPQQTTPEKSATPEAATPTPATPPTSTPATPATQATPTPAASTTPVPNVLGTSPTTPNQPTEKLTTPSPAPTSQPPTPTPTPLGSSFETKKGGKGKLVALLLVPVLLLAAFFGAWALDQNSRGERVARNTQINGVDISGLSGEELSTAITQATDDVLDVDLTVNANDDSIVTTPRALGAEPDIEATTKDALESRRSGFILTRPFSWASSFLRTDQVSATYLVDQKAADEASQTIFEPIIKPVVETSIEAQGSGFLVVPGEKGERIEATEIENELPDALGGSETPVLELTPVEGVPQISEADAKAVADEASAALEDPLEVQLLDNSTTVEPNELLKMVALDNSESDLTWTIDNDLAVGELKKKFTSVGTDGEEASFTIVNDKPVVVPVAGAVECCDETTGERLKEAALERPAEGEFVVVEPEYVDEDPTADELNSYGIIEEVSSFTTPHAAGGPRVTNIQRFADLMRGTVIEVDGELSLNEAVGKRTIEKGFVADGAINQGVIEKQVGGGISQFATTFFNASFFSGIEIKEHQFHTLAIGSRYPLGRESTIDYPSVDVRVKNTSEHPILIWTSYTDTSITVTFYSQKHLTVRDVNGDELAFDVYERGRDSTFPPEIGSDRQCKVYTTRRFTEFPDGTIVEDSFSGFYRPGEGRDCNGDLTPKAQAELDAKNAANGG